MLKLFGVYIGIILWEVYIGRVRFSEVIEGIGMITKIFGFEIGWNFAF